MCGITGVFEYGRTQGGVTDDLVLRMRETLRHRGPDGEGVYITPDRRVGFGHRRLAIVDIAGGAQPMFGPNGTCVVFNGEIYNYPALRAQLEADGARFETRCDTEVILHLYERLGERCVEQLNGMFAFALWDPRDRSVFFARDHVGEKPLYWADHAGTFVFGSEIKAILQHPAVPREVNEAAIGPYLANLVTPGPATLYRGINKLPAGHRGRCDARGVRLERYWSVAEPRRFADVPLEEAAARVRRLLEDSIVARLMSDVPVGVLLSGGVDSTTIVALLRERAAGLSSYTIGYPGAAEFDERDEARAVAEHYGTEHHEIELSEEEAVADLTALVHHQDEPLADPTCLPLQAVCRLARDTGTKVLLAGEGADELFWGYDGLVRTVARWPRLEAMLRMPRAVRRAAALATSADRAAHRRDRLDGIAAGRVRPQHMPLGLTERQRERALLSGRTDAGWAPGPNDGERGIATFAFDTQEHEFAVRLPELLLMRTDRFSMASSVETRVPFLDPALVDFVYRLPVGHKVHDGVSKYVLKRAIADSVPDWVTKRVKQGFTPPTSQWVAARHGGLLRELASQDTLRRYFDTGYLTGMIDSADPSSWESGHFLWPILNFGLWHKYWIEGEPLGDLLDEPPPSQPAARPAAARSRRSSRSSAAAPR